jgi:hypothetical protein
MVEFTEYLKDSENTEYPSRDTFDKFVQGGTKDRTRSVMTLDNVLNRTINNLMGYEIINRYDAPAFDEFRGISYTEQLDVLTHILKIQAFTIKKALNERSTIVLPYIGRFTFSKYYSLAIKIYERFKHTEETSVIRSAISDTLLNVQRSEERQRKKLKLSERKDMPLFNMNIQKRDLIDEGFSHIKGL